MKKSNITKLTKLLSEMSDMWDEHNAHTITKWGIVYKIKHKCYKFTSAETDWIIYDWTLKECEERYMDYISESELPEWWMEEADYFELLVVDSEWEKELSDKWWVKTENNTDADNNRYTMPLYEHINRRNYVWPEVAFSTDY